jgi:hypothetical protein
VGLFLSSLTKRASDTLILLLFLWVLFLFVIPNGSAYLASRIRPIESREKVDSQVRGLWERFQKEIQDFRGKNPISGWPVQSDASEPWGWYHRFAAKGLVRFKQKLNAYAEPLKIRYADDAWQATRVYLDSMKRQKELVELISRASPISLYERLMSGLSRTDVPSFERFANQAREYRRGMVDYLYGKNAFSSIRYFATVQEEHLFDINSMDEKGKYSRLREKYGSEEPLPLDVSDFPQFRYRSESVAITMKRILPDVVLLCFMNVFLFLCAFAAFLRYDAR